MLILISTGTAVRFLSFLKIERELVYSTGINSSVGGDFSSSNSLMHVHEAS